MTIILRKKDAMLELALSLFLMLEFDADTTAISIIRRIRDKAEAALKSAETYTGPFGQKDAQEFLNTRQYKFTLPCGPDIVKGDVIQFIEGVFDNRAKPPRFFGKRSVAAEVIDIRQESKNCALQMRVIASSGVWPLKPETTIRRGVGNVLHFEAMRAPWDNEAKRKEAPIRIKIEGGIV